MCRLTLQLDYSNPHNCHQILQIWVRYNYYFWNEQKQLVYINRKESLQFLSPYSKGSKELKMGSLSFHKMSYGQPQTN
jgi:hypothetical protein